MTTHTRAHERALRAYFEDELSLRDLGQVRDTVRACEVCRKAFEAYSSAESALYASRVSLDALDRVGRRVVGEPPKSSRAPVGVMAALAAAACAGLLLVLAPGKPSPDEFASRGGPVTSPAVTIRALAVSGSENPKIREAEGRLHLGERARIVATIDPSTKFLSARGVVRGPGKPVPFFDAELKTTRGIIGESLSIEESWRGSTIEVAVIFARSKEELARVPLDSPAGDGPGYAVRVISLGVDR
ncbi:MAG: hypothetical protein HYV07_13190 [Deltaproteobacteria bacterium]|nr:hypothetical protein [Deltaproteobacteria bacterium]